MQKKRPAPANQRQAVGSARATDMWPKKILNIFKKKA
jgi:hypothetical protein